MLQIACFTGVRFNDIHQVNRVLELSVTCRCRAVSSCSFFPPFILDKRSSPGSILMCFFLLGSKLISPPRPETEVPHNLRADSNMKAFWQKSYWRRLRLGRWETPSEAASKKQKNGFLYFSVLHAFKVRGRARNSLLSLARFYCSLLTISTLSY